VVALNVGQDFKKRWLNAPEAVRHAYQQDLARICDLLEPQTPIQLWVLNDEKAQLESQQNIEQAYADLKAELIEQLFSRNTYCCVCLINPMRNETGRIKAPQFFIKCLL